MSTPSAQRDVGAYLHGEHALVPTILTTTGDGSEINGVTIDRNAQDDLYMSAKVIIPYAPTLAAGETLTILHNMQDSPEGSTWTDFTNSTGGTVTTSVIGSTGSTAANTTDGVVQQDYSIGGAKRYVRIQVTATLSAAATDLVDIAGVMVFGGGDGPPAS